MWLNSSERQEYEPIDTKKIQGVRPHTQNVGLRLLVLHSADLNEAHKKKRVGTSASLKGRFLITYHHISCHTA